jgi:hypothetical protein
MQKMWKQSQNITAQRGSTLEIRRLVLCTISKEKARIPILRGYIRKEGDKQKAILIPVQRVEEFVIGKSC